MKALTPQIDDKILLSSLKKDDERAFNLLYLKYAKDLLHYTFSFIKNKTDSEEIVQEIFESIWNKRNTITIENSFKHYLQSAAKYQILNYIRSEKVKRKYIDHFNIFIAQHGFESTLDNINIADLKNIINKELDQLPGKCREAFLLSRIEHKTLAEVAKIMGISKRTVENYITQALKHLRKALKDYYWIYMLFSAI